MPLLPRAIAARPSLGAPGAIPARRHREALSSARWNSTWIRRRARYVPLVHAIGRPPSASGEGGQGEVLGTVFATLPRVKETAS